MASGMLFDVVEEMLAGGTRVVLGGVVEPIGVMVFGEVRV